MKTVFLDIDTQIDFMFPAGALYVPGAERILPAIARLNNYAVHHGELISTVDAHTENDPEFRLYPPHCVKGTMGQGKPLSTLAGQRIIEKRTTNCFFETNLAEILDTIGATRYVVYGVVTEICVKHAIFGLLQRGAEVLLVTDAVQSLQKEAAENTLRGFSEKGGLLTTAAVQAAGT